jgi:hypothetical protein
MGLHNLKFETEVFQQNPVFQPGQICTTPVETKPDRLDLSILAQVVSQVSQLTTTVNQFAQAIAAQTFTRAVPLAGAEMLNAEEIRKLTQRMDDLEAKLQKTNS